MTSAPDFASASAVAAKRDCSSGVDAISTGSAGNTIAIVGPVVVMTVKLLRRVSAEGCWCSEMP
jgi:hypothetical protein